MELYASIIFKDSRDKTGFHKLHVDVLGKLLAALGAEIFRFLIMQLTWKTLYMLNNIIVLPLLKGFKHEVIVLGIK